METKGDTLNYDQVLEYIGQFGRFQRKIFFWLWLISAASGLAVVVFVFTGLNPKYRYRVTDCEGGDSAYYENSTSQTLPPWLHGLQLKDQDCRIPTVTIGEDGKCLNASFTNQSRTAEFSELVFDRSIMTDTLIEEYSLVCERGYLRPIYSALYMLGMLFGSYIFGYISDKYGRMKAMLAATTCVSVSGFIGAFCYGVGGIHGYGLLRFITGMGGVGMFMSCFVLAVEHVGFKYTMLVGITIEVPFALGEALLGVEAYFIRDWKILQIVAYTPFILMLGLWWVVPESVRWLIANGQTGEAKQIIRDASRVNRRPCPEHLLQDSEACLTSKHPSLASTPSEAAPLKTKETKRISGLDLFNTKTMARRSLNMCFQWYSVTMVYYGLSFASTSIGGDAFSSFLLSCAIEIPGYIFCVMVMDCWGRRPILSFCQAVSGFSCIICGFLIGKDDLVVLQVFLSLVGKFGASASFAIVYVYTAEMFPTVIRNQAVGACSLVARIGGICSLLLDLLKFVWTPLPVFVMGCVAVAAGGLALDFPETLGEPLPDTLEDAFRIGKEKHRGICTCDCVSFHQLLKEELKDVPTTTLKN